MLHVVPISTFLLLNIYENSHESRHFPTFLLMRVSTNYMCRNEHCDWLVKCVNKTLNETASHGSLWNSWISSTIIWVYYTCKPSFWITLLLKTVLKSVSGPKVQSKQTEETTSFCIIYRGQTSIQFSWWYDYRSLEAHQ